MNSSVRYLMCLALAAAVVPAERALAQQSAPPAAAPAQATAAGPLASTEGESPGMRVEVTELKRSGNVVMLKFTVINESSEPFDFSYNLGDPEMGATDYGSVGGVHLIDNEGRKKYMVIRDAGDKCVCSKGLKRLEPQSRMTLWARFPAPPADVQAVSVMIPRFIPMDGVPLG